MDDDVRPKLLITLNIPNLAVSGFLPNIELEGVAFLSIVVRPCLNQTQTQA